VVRAALQGAASWPVWLIGTEEMVAGRWWALILKIFRRHRSRAMSLSFPNQSRFYDATRRAVRFWGHDSAMEASFFVTDDALKRIKPDMRFDEAGFLNAFDLNRDSIYAIAAKVYGRYRKGSYDLVAADF
jgi:hypothetical protein